MHARSPTRHPRARPAAVQIVLLWDGGLVHAVIELSVTPVHTARTLVERLLDDGHGLKEPDPYVQLRLLRRPVQALRSAGTSAADPLGELVPALLAVRRLRTTVNKLLGPFTRPRR